MANYVPASEALDDTGVWNQFDGLTVTANSHTAPAFAGISAGGADTVEDTHGGQTSSLYLNYQTIPADTLTYCIGLFIRKDTNASRFPLIFAEIQGPDPKSGEISCATHASTGGTVVEGGANVIDSGCVDVDAETWRFWFTLTNNNNTAVRMAIFPAHASTHGGSANGGLTGSIIAWGASIQPVATPTSAPPAYKANPPYFSIALSGTAVGGITEADIVAGGKTIICTLTGSTYIP